MGRAGGGERGVSHGKSHGGRDIFASLLRRQSRAGRCFVHTRAELRCDYARVGLALYGAAEGTAARSLGLRPVLSLRARVASVRDVAKGESVGYDRAFTARRKSRIAVLPIGYADGYPRALSNTGLVRIHGCLAPVAGRICMDQLAVDVTDVPGVVDGDIAELIGDASPLRAGEVAARCGTIPNELLSRLGARLPVVIK